MAQLSESPALSVLMCVRNAAPFLEASIASIRAQSWTDFEFLICDDGSDDDSAAIIQRHARHDSRIRPFFQPNRGLVPALADLMSQARAPLIARMDGDDIAHVDRFTRQMHFLATHPDHSLVGSQRRLIDKAGRLLKSNHPPLPLDHDTIMASTGGPAIFQNSVLFRKDPVLQIGGYRPAYIYCEDLDLCLRLGRIGKLANLPQPLIDYRVHPQQTSQAQRAFQLIHAEIALLMDRRVRAGLPDLSIGLEHLPSLDALDAWVGVDGTMRAIQSKCVATLMQEPAALARAGMDLVADYVTHAPHVDWPAIWLGIARLARARDYKAAAQLTGLLAKRLGRDRLTRQTAPKAYAD